MIDINKILITGRLTQDPELKYTPTGSAVCEMRIASGRSYVDKTSGDRKEDTVFINVSAWGKTAEFCHEYMRKGSGVYVEGRLKHDSWKDKDGNNRERISIYADKVQFGETKAEAQARTERGGSPGAPPPAMPSNDYPESRESSRPAVAGTHDDLPF